MKYRGATTTSPGAANSTAGFFRKLLAIAVLAVVVVAGSGEAAEPDAAQEEGAKRNYFRQYAEGLFARTVYEAEEPGRYRVEVWDLIAAPGKTTEPVSLAGAAVLEVRSGNCRVTSGDKYQEAPAGATVTVAEGQPLQIENRGDEPVNLRMVLIKAPEGD